MQQNKRTLLILLTTASLILIAVTGYPAVSRQIDKHNREEVFLEQTQQPNGTEEDLQDKKPDAQLSPDSNTNEQKDTPEIYLSLEDGSRDLKVSLWQSETGNCYFFLPGFAKGKGLLLENAADKNIYINDILIGETNVLRDISEETSCDLLVTDQNNNVLLHQPLIFMYSSDLPAMFMTTRSGNMDYVDSDKENEEAGFTALFDETGEALYSGGLKAIRGRGNSTWGLSKKPYQIKLNEDVDFFGFGPSRSWNLIANGYDETKLRNRITAELASRLEMNYVPESRMIDLYINHIYYGNYYLTEKIRTAEEGVAIRDMESFVNDAYNTRELSKLQRFQNEDGTRKWVATDIEMEDLTGGYLLERELASRFETETSGFITDQGDCYTLQSPAYATEDQVNYIADLMQEFQDAAEQEDGIHPTTGKHYTEYIDSDSFVQKYLVEEISKNYDGGVTSSFFYKPQDAVSNRIFAGPIWDYDVAFGNCNLDKIASDPTGITKLNNHVYGTEIFADLYEKEAFYDAAVTMYEEKALPYLNDLLEHGIDDMVSQIRSSVEMDRIRWEVQDNRYQYYEEYNNSVRYLKYFIEKRRDFLNEVWLEGACYHNLTFIVDDEPWQILCIKDGDVPENEPVPIRYNCVSLFLGWETANGVPFDRYKPIYEDMTFYAAWLELPIEDTEADNMH